MLKTFQGERGIIVSVDYLIIIATAVAIAAVVVGTLLGPLRSLHQRAEEGIKSLNETGF